MFAQFLQGQPDNQLLLILWITTIFTINNLVAFTVWTLAGDRIGVLFRSATNAQIVNSVLGGMLALVATWMLVS